MAMNIIRSRLAKALRLKDISSIYEQKRNPTRIRRRTRAQKGKTTRVVCSVSWQPEVLERLKSLSTKLMIQRSIIVNDAVEFYLGMAEQEIQESLHLSGADIISTTLAPDKVRRPDGVIVSLMEMDPGAKQPERQAQKYANQQKKSP